MSATGPSFGPIFSTEPQAPQAEGLVYPHLIPANVHTVVLRNAPDFSSSISPPAPTILQQRSILVREPRLTFQQAQGDALVSRIIQQIGSGRGLAFVVGGGVLVRSVSSTVQAFDLGTLTTVLSGTPQWRWAMAAVPVAAVGCGSGNGFSDAGDGGWRPVDAGSDSDASPYDGDGDGFPVSIDCNDGDPSTHPLPANDTIVINSSRTICPGTYHGSRIVIPPGTMNITLTGTGVFMDGTGQNEEGIWVNQAHQNLIQGFTLYNYSLGDAGVVLDSANNNTFQDMTVEAAIERNAFLIQNSADNTITRLQCNSHSDAAINAMDSTRITIRDSSFTTSAPLDSTPAYGLLTIYGGADHLIENNLFRAGPRYGLELFNMTNAQVINNRVLNNISNGIYTSGFRNGRIESCQVNGNGGYGLRLTNTSTGNVITLNNFTGNTGGATTADGSSSGNTFTGNTPPP